MMEIIEGNKLIAEYMGAVWQKDDYDDYGYFFSDGSHRPTSAAALKYHTSWDWLMPVVYAISNTWSPYNKNLMYDEHESSDIEIGINRVEIRTAGYKNGERFEFDYCAGWDAWQSERYMLSSVWQAVIEFIKWHNSNSSNDKQTVK